MSRRQPSTLALLALLIPILGATGCGDSEGDDQPDPSPDVVDTDVAADTADDPLDAADASDDLADIETDPTDPDAAEDAPPGDVDAQPGFCDEIPGDCIEVAEPGLLLQICPLVGSSDPFADDFAGDSLDADLWRPVVIGPTGSIDHGEGALRFETGEVPAEGLGTAGVMASCSFAPQDFTTSALVSIDAESQGDFMVSLRVRRDLDEVVDLALTAAVVESQGGDEVGFMSREDEPPPEVGDPVTFPRDTPIRLTLSYTLGTGHLAGLIESPDGETTYFDATTTFTQPPTLLSPAVFLAAITPAQTVVAVDTQAAASLSDFTSDLVDALPLFVAVVEPLTLNGRPYADDGVHFVIGEQLSVIRGPAPVVGLDGSSDLSAALVELSDMTAITFYTDLSEADFAAWLDDFDDGETSLDAFREGVFVAAGPADDFAFDMDALNP